MTLSPWSFGEVLASPNGRLEARIVEAYEIAMGAPTSGDLELAGLRIPGCNPSMVWSEDSRFLAIPQWTQSRAQRLLIVSLAHGRFQSAPETYRVLQLEGFAGGTVTGVDSPIHRPAPLSFAIGELRW